MVSKEADVEEIYEKIRELEESKEDTVSKMEKRPRVWFALILGAIALFTLMGYVDIKTGAGFAIAAVLIIRFVYGQEAYGRELTEQELCIKLYKALRYKQTHPLGDYYQISPDIKIQVERVGRRIRINGVPQERVLGVSFYNPRTGSKQWYRYTVDLKTADTTGCKELPAGFIDLNDWDVKIIESEKIRDEKRYNRALGVTPKRV